MFSLAMPEWIVLYGVFLLVVSTTWGTSTPNENHAPALCLEYNPKTSKPTPPPACTKPGECEIDVWDCGAVTDDGRGRWVYDASDLAQGQIRLQYTVEEGRQPVCLTPNFGDFVQNGIAVELHPCTTPDDYDIYGVNYAQSWYLSGNNLIRSQYNPTLCLVAGPRGLSVGSDEILSGKLGNNGGLYLWDCDDALQQTTDGRARWTHPPVEGGMIRGGQSAQGSDRFTLLHSAVGYDNRGSKQALVRAGPGMMLAPGVVPTFETELRDACSARVAGDGAQWEFSLATVGGMVLQTWSWDFSSFRSAGASEPSCTGHYSLHVVVHVAGTEAVELDSEPFNIANGALSGALIHGLTLGNAAARRAHDFIGGYIDCNLNMAEANSNGAFMAALLQVRSAASNLKLPVKELDDSIEVLFQFFVSMLWDRETGHVANGADCGDVHVHPHRETSYCGPAHHKAFRTTTGEYSVGARNNLATANALYAFAEYLDTYRDLPNYKDKVTTAYDLVEQSLGWMVGRKAFPRTKREEYQCLAPAGNEWRKETHGFPAVGWRGCHRPLEALVLVRTYRYTKDPKQLDSAYDSVCAWLQDRMDMPLSHTSELGYDELTPESRLDGLLQVARELRELNDVARLGVLVDLGVQLAEHLSSLLGNSPYAVLPILADKNNAKLRNPGIAMAAADAATLGVFLLEHGGRAGRELADKMERLSAGSISWITGLHIGISREHTSANDKDGPKSPLLPASMVTNGPGVFALPWRFAGWSASDMGKQTTAGGGTGVRLHPVGQNPLRHLQGMYTIPLGFLSLAPGARPVYESTAMLTYPRSGSPSAEAYMLSDAWFVSAVVKYEQLLDKMAVLGAKGAKHGPAFRTAANAEVSDL